MIKKSLAIIAALSLSGCIAVPRVDIPETLTFDYQIQNVQPMTYTDLLCCHECSA